MFIIQIISFLLFVFLVKESPVWLLLNDRKEEAIDIYNYIGRFNGVAEDKLITHDSLFAEQIADTSQNTNLTKPSDREPKTPIPVSSTTKSHALRPTKSVDTRRLNKKFSETLTENVMKIHSAGLEDNAPKQMISRQRRT